MKWSIALLLLLAACGSVSTSDIIVKDARKTVSEVRTAIKAVEQSVTPDCRTDAFSARLDGLIQRVDSLGSAVETVGNACNTEKQVLKEKLATRDVIISTFLLLVVGRVMFAIFKK